MNSATSRMPLPRRGCQRQTAVGGAGRSTCMRRSRAEETAAATSSAGWAGSCAAIPGCAQAASFRASSVVARHPAGHLQGHAAMGVLDCRGTRFAAAEQEQQQGHPGSGQRGRRPDHRGHLGQPGRTGEGARGAGHARALAAEARGEQGFSRTASHACASNFSPRQGILVTTGRRGAACVVRRVVTGTTPPAALVDQLLAPDAHLEAERRSPVADQGQGAAGPGHAAHGRRRCGVGAADDVGPRPAGSLTDQVNSRSAGGARRPEPVGAGGRNGGHHPGPGRRTRHVVDRPPGRRPGSC